MDWDRAIERNSEALRRIIASLVAMAGFAASSTSPSPLWGFEADLPIEPVARSSAEKAGEIAEQSGSPAKRQASGSDPTMPPTRPSDDGRPPHSFDKLRMKGEVERRPTLPRYLHTAVLRILRPAESAMRRLIVVASRGIVVTLPAPRPRKQPAPVPVETTLRGLGIAVTLSPADLARAAARRAAEARAPRAARPQSLSLPLLDPLKNHFRPRRKFVPPHLGPRVSSLGGGERRALPPPPSRDDAIDATRIGLRLAALAAALDDLPGQAKRFARWKARSDRALAEERNRAVGQKTGQPLPHRRRRPIRIWPLRSGRPPGQCPRRARKSGHEVHQILSDLHNLAFDVLEGLDTS